MKKDQPWYHGITRYEWLVLVIASAGWIFDVYEGQIFNITRDTMLADILRSHGNAADVQKYGDIFLGVFLLGGTVGGLAAGSLADRFGRRPIMIATILIYSIFSGLTYMAIELWHVAALRFLVAMGVGGEWAVAASLVAEVFPSRARAQASGIFHASSVLGTWMAALAGLAVGAHWRYAYLMGIVPALLIVWVRAAVKEPASWQAIKVHGPAVRLGSFSDLLRDPIWSRRALLGMGLAAVGLGTYWAVTVAGQDLARQMLLRHGATAQQASQRARFAYGVIETAGNGVGLVMFGPICARIGRRPAFILIQILALLIVPITCFVPQTYAQLLALLPIYGCLTGGMHSGFAIYFPELFPTRLRATGASFCFNGGRIVAAPILLLSGWLKSREKVNLGAAISCLSILFLAGIICAHFLPETKGKDLPT